MSTFDSFVGPQSLELRAILDDALRFWELRRIPYNLILAAVVIAWVAASWPHLHEALLWPALLALFVMAALANVLYSVAYCLDIFIQFSSFRELWRRYRWVVWVAGVLLGVALANFWILMNFH
ncbi:MAG TPA: hypothetical protein VKS20_04725 [Candidatus Acidoferrales bacterium]|nr:hypothetical protein [Candidatus Acidoferrales bacterium]